MVKTTKKVEDNPITVNHKKKKSKKRPESWSRYIYKVFKIVHPNLEISKKSMSIMNSLVNDMFERICREAGRLAMSGKRKRLTSREVQTSVKLNFSGKLSMHAIKEK